MEEGNIIEEGEICEIAEKHRDGISAPDPSVKLSTENMNTAIAVAEPGKSLYIVAETGRSDSVIGPQGKRDQTVGTNEQKGLVTSCPQPVDFASPETISAAARSPRLIPQSVNDGEFLGYGYKQPCDKNLGHLVDLGQNNIPPLKPTLVPTSAPSNPNQISTQPAQTPQQAPQPVKPNTIPIIPQPTPQPIDPAAANFTATSHPVAQPQATLSGPAQPIASVHPAAGPSAGAGDFAGKSKSAGNNSGNIRTNFVGILGPRPSTLPPPNQLAGAATLAAGISEPDVMNMREDVAAETQIQRRMTEVGLWDGGAAAVLLGDAGNDGCAWAEGRRWLYLYVMCV
ncbi:transducin family protein / WD-40 repeat family protein [Striga asiatica]|uniref:Transducin family protein / WD-40 repeat family protein n=1 Tax=Striga asiatica TaxID=4170 RepID=A0A5A7PW55_STRAF|nr:transducin family protein / WD-40 repeat family protein [Striga asiatica]